MNTQLQRTFKKIGIIGRHHQTPLTETLNSLISELGREKISFLIEKETAENAHISDSSIHSNLGNLKADLSEIQKTCDLIISIGGDGNFLRTARLFYEKEIPIIGINKGQLGYLTDIHPQEISSLLKIIQGEYSLEERFFIRSKISRNKTQIASHVALNDVVLFPGEIAQMIEFEVHIDQKFVYRQRSDGLILATPTGSTAYSLSAGGPILHPAVPAFVLTPMMPHSLTTRPIVISAESSIDIYLSEANKTKPRLNHDGQENISLEVGDCIHLEKAPKKAKLVHPMGYDYYSALRSKLNWSEQPIFNVR
jgi:NAD+ kinase